MFFILHFDMMLIWCWYDVEMMLKWCWNDVEMMLKWCWNDVEMMLKWCWNDVEMMLKCLKIILYMKSFNMWKSSLKSYYISHILNVEISRMYQKSRSAQIEMKIFRVNHVLIASHNDYLRFIQTLISFLR